ncbi:MAG: YwqG family protein [Pseudomonadota bacterium]
MRSLLGRLWGGDTVEGAVPLALAPDVVRREVEAVDRAAVALIPLDEAPRRPAHSAFGGPVFVTDGGGWPRAPSGRPMVLLARIHFADLPRPVPAGLPQEGLLQILVEAESDGFGTGPLPEPGAGLRIDWWAQNCPGRLLAPPPGLDPTPFRTPEIAAEGVRIGFEPARIPLSPVDARLETLLAHVPSEDLPRLIDSLPARHPAHYLGGHPHFADEDPRDGELLNWDRCLIQVGSGPVFCWGDEGEATVLMRRDDLAGRRFDRALFLWDSY